MKSINLIVLAIIVILLVQPCSAKVGVGVGTGRITVDELLMPGGTYKISSMSVINTGDEASNYSVKVTYLYEQKELRPPVEWVVFESKTFHLEPNEAEVVELRLNIPMNAEPGDYFCFLEAHPVTEGEGFRIGVAAASKLYFSVKPANIISAAFHKISSFIAATAPASYIFAIAALLIAAVMVLRKHISIEVRRKKPPEGGS